MMHPAAVAEIPAQTEPALRRDECTGSQPAAAAGHRNLTPVEELFEPGLAQAGRDHPGHVGVDEPAPCRRGAVVTEPGEELVLQRRLGLEPAQHGRHLQRQQSGAAKRLDRGVGQPAEVIGELQIRGDGCRNCVDPGEELGTQLPLHRGDRYRAHQCPIGVTVR